MHLRVFGLTPARWRFQDSRRQVRLHRLQSPQIVGISLLQRLSRFFSAPRASSTPTPSSSTPLAPQSQALARRSRRRWPAARRLRLHRSTDPAGPAGHPSPLSHDALCLRAPLREGSTTAPSACRSPAQSAECRWRSPCPGADGRRSAGGSRRNEDTPRHERQRRGLEGESLVQIVTVMVIAQGVPTTSVHNLCTL